MSQPPVFSHHVQGTRNADCCRRVVCIPSKGDFVMLNHKEYSVDHRRFNDMAPREIGIEVI